MKNLSKIIAVILIFAIALSSSTFATSGRLQKDSIKTCPNGVVYGKHGDGHWHVATRNSDGSYNASGSPLASDPCPNASASGESSANTSGSTTPRAAEQSSTNEAQNEPSPSVTSEDTTSNDDPESQTEEAPEEDGVESEQTEQPSSDETSAESEQKAEGESTNSYGSSAGSVLAGLAWTGLIGGGAYKLYKRGKTA